MRLSGSGISAIRGGRTVFADLAFSVDAGELLAVTGPNGSGKSTLLRLIAGLLPPAAGAVALDPIPEGGLSGEVHYLGHLDALKPTLTVAENLRFWRRLWGGSGSIDEALDTVGIGGLDFLPAGVLSAGQKRRVALARMLVAHRPVWLLDEPLTALDAAAEGILGRLIAGHLGQSGIVVAATHRDLPVPPSTTLALAAAA